VLYVIYAEDIADSLEKRLSVRPAHLARLQLLQDEGRLLTAGPMPAVDSNDLAPPGLLAQRSLRSLNRWKSPKHGQMMTLTSRLACTRTSP
jgi:uncharacterized protein YciI